MGISRDIPQVAALQDAVARRFGAPLRVHSDFVALADSIIADRKCHISEMTLERLWGYSTRKSSNVSFHTLDMLACYAGYESWDEFCRSIKGNEHKDSDFFDSEGIDALALPHGARLRIGWYPDRICVIRHLGDGRFVAEECDNATLRPGDTFMCHRLDKGHPLVLNNLVQAGNPGQNGRRYVAGINKGLALLEILE